MYNFNHLFYFYTVVKQGSLLSGAQHLRISQPGLCNQIKLLEGELGVQLFRKSGRCNVLTDSGHSIFGTCEKMFDAANDIKDFINKSNHEHIQMLKVGHSSEIPVSFLLLCVAQFLKLYDGKTKPEIQLIPLSENSPEVFHPQPDLDVVFSRRAPSLQRGPLHSRIESDVFLYSGGDSLDSEVLLQDAIDRKIPYLSKSRLIVTEKESDLRKKTEAYLEKSNLQFVEHIEVGSLSAMCTCLRQGLGVAFAPSNCFIGETKFEDMRKNSQLGSCWKDTFYVSSPCGEHCSAAAKEFFSTAMISC